MQITTPPPQTVLNDMHRPPCRRRQRRPRCDAATSRPRSAKCARRKSSTPCRCSVDGGGSRRTGAAHSMGMILQSMATTATCRRRLQVVVLMMRQCRSCDDATAVTRAMHPLLMLTQMLCAYHRSLKWIRRRCNRWWRAYL